MAKNTKKLIASLVIGAAAAGAKYGIKTVRAIMHDKKLMSRIKSEAIKAQKAVEKEVAKAAKKAKPLVKRAVKKARGAARRVKRRVRR